MFLLKIIMLKVLFLFFSKNGIKIFYVIIDKNRDDEFNVKLISGW